MLMGASEALGSQGPPAPEGPGSHDSPGAPWGPGNPEASMALESSESPGSYQEGSLSF